MSKKKPVPPTPLQEDDRICDACQALYEEVGNAVREREVFEKVRRTDEALKCRARDVESEANYYVEVERPGRDKVWVGLYTPDRWLSESIEADLMHLGDKIEDLLDEELVDQGYERGPLPVEHFRDEQKRYVFRSPVAVEPGGKVDDPATVDAVTRVLLAYEACFRQLGDMAPDDDAL